MPDQPGRLAHGGRIDRARPLTVRFDGRPLTAYPGDTLAAALLAAGVRVVGRSFKYHRPRGVFAAGVEEPNALVRVRRGGRAEPNTRATSVEAFDGLEAQSQNAWPSVDHDLGAIAGLFSRFLPAGFYYKTFMGFGRGTRAWMFFEHYIRKAAGMGRATLEADPDDYERVSDFCDVLVVGAGPAGLAAALSAGRSGARVVLAEQDFLLGGSLLGTAVGGDADRWLGRASAELARMDNVLVLPRTTVFGAYDGDVFGLVERAWDHVQEPPAHQPRQRFRVLRTRATVLATGATEQPAVFPGNDLPGVMLASAPGLYLHRFGVLAGQRPVFVTGNDSTYPTALGLARAGAEVTVVDTRAGLPETLTAPLREQGVRVLEGHRILRAGGWRVLRWVEVAAPAGSTERLSCDLLGTSGGWAPVLHLWSQRGCKPVFDAGKAAFVPNPDALPTLRCAGACAGDGTLDAAVAGGAREGSRAAARAGLAETAGEIPVPETAHSVDWTRAPAPLTAAQVNGQAAGKAFVDLQHDVAVSDVALAHREGFASAEHLKRYTTAGMAADQGKTSGVNALAGLADLEGAPLSSVGTTTFRPPYTPVTIGAVAGRVHGQHLRPTRYTPMHDWHAARGAVMTDAGLWKRPRYYPREGETLREAYTREAAHVRARVGLVDVSTLGKVAVQGPDAGEFLNRVYVNGWKQLRVGRIRYGVMLRDDGFVLDDGVTARLSETEYLMSTTTANAAPVLARLEYLLATAWTDLRVHVTGVTDQWGAVAVAGPAARDLLRAACPGADLSAEALPNMAFVETEVAEVPVRVHRMSYSGELAYEVYSPAGHGQQVWNALLAAGEPLGAEPYGTEAMGTLRIEKGHVAGPEIDGRTTLRDLGLDVLASTRKPFAGSVLRGRTALEAPQRPVLVGLEVLDEAASIHAGALLYPATGEPVGHGEGHVTSVTWSPACGRYIGLALLAGGGERTGEVMRCVDFLADSSERVRVTSPHFFDPDGRRQNA